GLNPRIAMEIDGVPAILDLVSEGLGYAVLPRHAVFTASKPERYLLHPVRPARLIAEISIVTSARRTTTQTQRRAMELIKAATLEL
ncbi:MAG: LysR family transcriptional regulator, partial [Alcaligenaceae bacterium]